MGDDDGEPTESPATWENLIVGKAKEFLGHVTGDEKLTEEGEEQVEIAHEVHDEFDEGKEVKDAEDEPSQ
jgi:uncharacterized protein YjbJ (UPF0337 family)